MTIIKKIFIIIYIINTIGQNINCSKTSKEDISLCMVGDLLIHTPILDYAKSERKNDNYNFDFIFENIKKYINQYDIKIINDEVLIAGVNYGISGFPRFNSPIELSDSVVKAGFNVILKATNHVNDKNEEARLEDLNNWKRFKDVIVTGSYINKEESEKITYFNKNGIKIALLNYCYGSNRFSKISYSMNKIIYEKLEENIKKARTEGTDIIILLPHWGREYSLKENKYQKKWSQIFFDLGVDLVIGTHPHVIQPVEIMEDKETNRKMYIFYSIGNFINATSRRGKNIFWRFLGGMAHIIIGKEKNKAFIKEVKFIPLITHIYGKNGKITTFKVKDYNENMAENNYISTEYDKDFSYENMIHIFKSVINEEFLDFNY